MLVSAALAGGDPDRHGDAARSCTSSRRSAASHSCSTRRGGSHSRSRWSARSELPNAVALNSGLLNASRVIGPALAGIVIAGVGVGACFVVNTLSFVAVLVALLAMRRDELFPVAPRSRLDAAGRHARRAGVRAGTTRRCAIVLIVVTCLGLVGFNFNTLVPLLASDTLHVGARAFGLLSAAFGVGALAGAIATASFRRATFNAFVLGIARVQHLPAPAGARPRCAGRAGSSSSSSAPRSPCSPPTPTRSSSSRRPIICAGASIALYLFAFVGLAPIGSLVSGWLVEVGGTPLAFSIAGLVGLAATAYAVFGTRDAASTRTREHSAGVSHRYRGCPADEEELDDDLREPRLQLRHEPDGRSNPRCRRRTHDRNSRDRRRACSAPPTCAASSSA